MRELVKYETVMTYEDWEQEYLKRTQQAKGNAKYFLVQKLLGCVLIIMSLITAYVINDGTHCVILVPLGLYLSLTTEKVLMIGRR